ncbi:hypothetical protein N7535_007904 [Penicillium sp. DV-2018c]|nr:hypothetical protein N7535_007904 [Penicillium sp. DV-2018c]
MRDEAVATEREMPEVKDEHKFDGETHFLIKWKGWPAEYNEWVPDDRMGHAEKAIADYRKKKKAEEAKKAKKAKKSKKSSKD